MFEPESSHVPLHSSRSSATDMPDGKTLMKNEIVPGRSPVLRFKTFHAVQRAKLRIRDD